MASAERSKIPPLPMLRALDLVRNGLDVLRRHLVPGHIALLEMQVTGFLSQAIHAAADLGIADALAAGPLSPHELAKAVGADEDALRRLMRLLLSFDIFAQRRDGSYRLNDIAEALRSDADISLRDLTLFFGSAYHRNHWSHLADAVRTGRSVGPVLDGMEFFEYAAVHRDIGVLFDRAMASTSSLSREPLLSAYDFGQYRSIVDVAGGRGSLLMDILHRHPHMHGTLFELPEVVAGLSEEIAGNGLSERLSIETGSFFETAPKGGDAYILKHIVHDWSDEKAGDILRTVRAAMPGESRLLIIDIVMPEHSRPHGGKFIDLEMLVHTQGGRERTRKQFRNLLSRSGFRLERVVPTAAPDSLVEARPIR